MGSTLWITRGSIAVLDWEFASSTLGTWSHLQRGLAEGYRAAGGELPAEWQRLALLHDSLAWIDFASRPTIHALVLKDARARIARAVEVGI